jgi:lipoate-protein ligase A
MRQPRHDTPLSLPAEHPREALARDEQLLEQVDGLGGQPLERWWVASTPAIVVGLGLRNRLTEIVDVGYCQATGVDVFDRRAGGGVVLVDGHMVCGAVCVPQPDHGAGNDLVESYRWLGDRLVSRVQALGINTARRVEVDEARADVRALRAIDDPVAALLLKTCFGALSPHEIVVGGRKLVGLAQIRRRHAALFQFGILVRDQSPVADYLIVSEQSTRARLRAELVRRTVGLDSLSRRGQSASAMAAAVAGARPDEP